MFNLNTCWPLSRLRIASDVFRMPDKDRGLHSNGMLGKSVGHVGNWWAVVYTVLAHCTHLPRLFLFWGPSISIWVWS